MPQAGSAKGLTRICTDDTDQERTTAKADVFLTTLLTECPEGMTRLAGTGEGADVG